MVPEDTTYHGITRFHGIDRHLNYSTITVKDREGNILHRQGQCINLSEYLASLGPTDAVAFEVGNCAFHHADIARAAGAAVYVVDPRKFRIICQSNKKSDRNDSMNLCSALRAHILDTDNFVIPLVFCPSPEIRRLRQLFSSHRHLNKTIVALKNDVTGKLRDCGVRLDATTRYALYEGKDGIDVLKRLAVHPTTILAIEPLIDVIHMCIQKKAGLVRDIILAGEAYQDDVRLLISIKGITPLTALAFISDVADLSRFSSVRKLTAYLGLVPLTKSSGGKTYYGHIMKTSRSITRTLLTQSLPHILQSHHALDTWYQAKRIERGAGRARIGVVRKTVILMRSMLLKRELYAYTDEKAYQRKLYAYLRILNKGEKAA